MFNIFFSNEGKISQQFFVGRCVVLLVAALVLAAIIPWAIIGVNSGFGGLNSGTALFTVGMTLMVHSVLCYRLCQRRLHTLKRSSQVAYTCLIPLVGTATCLLIMQQPDDKLPAAATPLARPRKVCTPAAWARLFHYEHSLASCSKAA